jgi:hypothetical protein
MGFLPYDCAIFLYIIVIYPVYENLTELRSKVPIIHIFFLMHQL